MSRRLLIFTTIALSLVFSVVERVAHAQQTPSADSLLSGDSTLGSFGVLLGLSLLPFAFMTLTSFAKISIVFSVLRNALGTPQVPSGLVISALAFVLSVYVMAPVGQQMLTQMAAQSDSGDDSVEAWAGRIIAASDPLQEFLARNSGESERTMFRELRAERQGSGTTLSAEEDDWLILAPAFLITELEEAFQIAFFIFLPFLVVDIVVANTLLALGMHMMSPTTVSLPFKLLLLVMVDGLTLIAKGLVLGYA